jgi:hypothetical protein
MNPLRSLHSCEPCYTDTLDGALTGLIHLRLLLIQYVAASASGHTTEAALVRKDKRPLPFPLCCFRFRPTKPAFMHVLKVVPEPTPICRR